MAWERRPDTEHRYFRWKVKRGGRTVRQYLGRGILAEQAAALVEQRQQLERLTIAGKPFNDEGMEALGKLTQLKEVGTWHTGQTARGMAHLKELKNLTRLHRGQRLYDGKPSLTDDTMALALLAREPRPSLFAREAASHRRTHQRPRTLRIG